MDELKKSKFKLLLEEQLQHYPNCGMRYASKALLESSWIDEHNEVCTLCPPCKCGRMYREAEVKEMLQLLEP